jgi:Antibiotic biosynthesis monooxygenase
MIEEKRPYLGITMYKFLITIKLQPGTRDKILEAAPEVQKATRAEEGCISHDFFTCTDDPDRLAFIECLHPKRRLSCTANRIIQKSSEHFMNSFTNH